MTGLYQENYNKGKGGFV